MLLTVGHGTLEAGELARLLLGAGVSQVVDVRSYPGSRRHPHFARAEMQRWLPEAGVGYSWAPDLGGRRKPDPRSPNVALRHPSFRAYADHMSTPQFSAALDALVAESVGEVVAAMCAESVWWKCHRRLLADAAVLLRGTPVQHLMHDGRLRPHAPSPEARVVDARLLYDIGETGRLEMA